MKTNRNTDQLFEHMRKMPVEVPLENVEKFVIAQAALGITAVGASKGIFTKAFLKFHLNSIIIMTTTFTAALVSFFVWNANGDKIAATKNHQPKSEFSSNAFVPDIETAADTPRTTTTKVIADGQSVSVTTIETENGTKIKVIDNGGTTSVYYNTTNDSSYVYAYSSTDDAAAPPYPAVPATPAHEGFSFTHPIPPAPPAPPAGCCSHPNDTLTSIIGKALLKDGLISDTSTFTFKLNNHSLMVDGKKQSKELHAKYKKIIEQNSSYKVNPLLIISICRDEEQNAVGMMESLSPMPPMPPMAPLATELAQMEMELAQMKDEMVHWSYNDSLMQTIEKTLFKDGLIKDTAHYMFKINGSYMKVNGEKMSKEQWKRYKDLIESSSMNKVNKKFSYAIARDGEEININVENYVD